MAQQHTNSKSYYEILGIPRSASVKEIKKSYHELARLYHPDSNFYADIIDDKLSSQQIELFKIITCAYQTLIDPHKREQYDSSIIPKLNEQNVTSWDEQEKDEFWNKKSDTSVSIETKNTRKRTATFGQTGTRPFRATLHDGELRRSDIEGIKLHNLVKTKTNAKKAIRTFFPLLLGLSAGILVSLVLFLALSPNQSGQISEIPKQKVNNSDSELWRKNLAD